MNRGKIMDKRCPLTEGTRIFDQTNKRTYCILESKGQGALCLAYRAFYTDNLDKKHSVILKELFPVNLGIERAADGFSLDIPANQIHTYSNLQKHFLQAYETQNSFHEQDTLMNATSDSRDIFFANNTHYAVIGIDAGDTYDRYADTTCRELFEIIRSVARAVFEYHKAGYLHLDIKPDNFFVLKGTTSVKLIDFDSIHKIEEVHKLLFPISYSIGYAAPEVLECRESFENALKINVQSDVYSIGAMIFNRLFGRFPDIDDQYPGRDTRWEQWIHQCKLLDKASPKLQWELKQLFHKTLRYHPEDRCDTAQLVAQLDLLVKLASTDSYYLSDQDIHVTTSKAHYISRLQALNRIREMLLRPDSHLVFLSGIGGSGKTETAREYAEMYRHQYHTIQFANYSGSLKNTIISLNYQNYQDFEDQEPDKKYEDKISELGEHDGHTLLIIDNFDEDLVIDEKRDDEVTVSIKRSNADVLDKLASLRNAESGDSIHILITTRNQPATGSYIKDFLPLENLSEPELTQLFFSINPHDAENRERHQLVHDLLQITSCHTMTVSLVASLSKEAEDYGEPGLEAICALLKKEGLSHLNGEVSYEKDRVSKNAEAFIHLKTLFRFNKMSDEEKYVLSNMVLVPVTGMRKKEFCSWVLSDTVKSVRIPVEKLIHTGWIIEINDPDNSIHLHPLISEVVLDELKPDEKACSAFLQKLKLIMEKTKEIHWGNPYLPFAMLIAKLFGKEIDSMQKAELLMCTANFLDSPHNAKLDSIIKSIEIKIRLFSFLVKTLSKDDLRLKNLFDELCVCCSDDPVLLIRSRKNYELWITSLLDLTDSLPLGHPYHIKACVYFVHHTFSDEETCLEYAQKAIDSQIIELQSLQCMTLEKGDWEFLWRIIITSSEEFRSNTFFRWLIDAGQKILHIPACITPNIAKDYCHIGYGITLGRKDDCTMSENLSALTSVNLICLGYQLCKTVLPLEKAASETEQSLFLASCKLQDVGFGIDCMMEILDDLLKILPPDHLQIEQICVHINSLCWNLKSPSKVLKIQIKIFNILLRTPLSKNIWKNVGMPISTSCDLICQNCLHAEDYQETLKVMTIIQDLYENYMPQHSRQGDLYSNMSELYNRIGDFSRAKEYKKRAMYFKRGIYFPKHPTLTAICSEIKFFLRRAKNSN